MNTVAGKIVLTNFEKWLSNQGCEILPVTNEFEAIRFKGKSTGVLYKSGKVSSHYVITAIKSYKSGNRWNGKPVSTGRNQSYKKEKEIILERDGTKCFYCQEEMGEDITLEHLKALSKGGKSSVEDCVLMHEKCNNKLQNLGLVEKIELIIEKRKTSWQNQQQK